MMRIPRSVSVVTSIASASTAMRFRFPDSWRRELEPVISHKIALVISTVVVGLLWLCFYSIQRFVGERIADDSGYFGLAIGTQVAVITAGIPLVIAVISLLLEDEMLATKNNFVVIDYTKVVQFTIFCVTSHVFTWAVFISPASHWDSARVTAASLTIICVLLILVAVLRGLWLALRPSTARRHAVKLLKSSLRSAVENSKNMARFNLAIEKDLESAGVLISAYDVKDSLYSPIFSDKSGYVGSLDTGMIKKVLWIMTASRESFATRVASDESDWPGNELVWLARVGQSIGAGEFVIALIPKAIARNGPLTSKLQRLLNNAIEIDL